MWFERSGRAFSYIRRYEREIAIAVTIPNGHSTEWWSERTMLSERHHYRRATPKNASQVRNFIATRT